MALPFMAAPCIALGEGDGSAVCANAAVGSSAAAIAAVRNSVRIGIVEPSREEWFS